MPLIVSSQVILPGPPLRELSSQVVNGEERSFERSLKRINSFAFALLLDVASLWFLGIGERVALFNSHVKTWVVASNP